MGQQTQGIKKKVMRGIGDTD